MPRLSTNSLRRAGQPSANRFATRAARTNRRAALARLGGALLGLAAAPRAADAEPDVPIAVASSLRFAWPALRAAAGDPALVPSFGASRTLAQQMRRGAPFELLLSADAESIALLVDAGLADAADVIEYARGRLVLVVRDRVDGLTTTATLPEWLAADHARRLAIAHPEHAPYGRAALQALATLSNEPSAPSHLVRGENAAQALQFFATGAAEAALLPASLVRQAAADLLHGRGVGWRELEVDPDLHQPLRHRAVAVHRAGPAARSLLGALQGAAVQRTLLDAGLLPVGGEADGADGADGADES